MQKVKIEGKEDYIRALEKLQDVKLIRNTTRKAMRSAIRVPLSQFKKMYPSKARKQIKYQFLDEKGDKPTSAAIGMFNPRTGEVTPGKDSRDPKWYAYMTMYWTNYGTLSNRDPNHRFVRPRRGKRERSKGGIKPTNKFEKTMPSVLQQIKSRFEEEMPKALEEMLKKR